MRSSSETIARLVMVGALACALFCAACTITSYGQDDCATTADCRAAFGIGWSCGADGYCIEAPPSPRCTTTFPDDLFTHAEAYEGSIVIGCIADESLDTQRFRERSIGLALAQVNESGALPDHQFAVVCCNNAEDSSLDTLDNVDAAVRVANYLVDGLGVSAIVGPSRSEEVEKVFEAVAPRDVLIISPSATSPGLTALEPDATDAAPGLLWRTAPPDALQGQTIANDMIARGMTRVAVVAEAGSYGEGLAAVFETAFQGTGRSSTTFVFTSSTQRDTVVADLAPLAFTEVLFASSDTMDAVAFLRGASVLRGYDTKSFFLSDGAANQDLLTMASDVSVLFPRVRLTRPGAPAGDVYDAFQSAYVALYGFDEVSTRSFTAHAFDAAWLAFYGAAWADAQDGARGGRAMAGGLRNLSSGTELDVRPTSWTRIRNAFGRDMSVNITGASGPLDYNPITEETSGTIELLTIDAAGTGFVVE